MPVVGDLIQVEVLSEGLDIENGRAVVRVVNRRGKRVQIQGPREVITVDGNSSGIMPVEWDPNDGLTFSLVGGDGVTVLMPREALAAEELIDLPYDPPTLRIEEDWRLPPPQLAAD